MLDCATLFGQVILLPLVNSKGFFAGVKQLNPADGRNLNREFPGKEDGTETQRMAWTIEKLLYPEADFLLDLHGGDWNEELAPLVFFPCGAGQKVEQETRRAAQALSVSMRVCSTARNGLYSWAAQKGIPALLLERGGNGRWTPEEVEADCEDVLRLMNHLGIRKGEFDAVPQTEIAKAVYEEALADGYWFPQVCAGQEVLRMHCWAGGKAPMGRRTARSVQDLQGGFCMRPLHWAFAEMTRSLHTEQHEFP